jgi:hypothetical protein
MNMKSRCTRFKWARFPVLLITSLVATSCGGGGGGGGNSPPATPSPPPPAAKQFADVSAASGISFSVEYTQNPGDLRDVTHFAGGVASGDYDNDGDIDLFVLRGDSGANRLYRNDGNNVFADVADTAGLAFTRSATENWRHSGPAFADMDGDGDLDLFLGGVQTDPSLIFKNNGNGTFTDVTAGSGLDLMIATQTVSAAFGDYDLDGDVDMFLAHWGVERSEVDPGDTEHLWRNESTLAQIQFVSVSEAAGISPSIITLPDPKVWIDGIDYSFAPTFVHLNDDLYPDLVIAADVHSSMVFMNNTDGTFTNTTDVDVMLDANGMGSAVGDYDNDGDNDWFVTSIFRDTSPLVENGNRLYRNDDGAFVDVTDTAGVADGGWGWAACMADLDNDGHLDLYHTNGWPFTTIGDYNSDISRAFMSNGDGTFTNRANEMGLDDRSQGRGAVCADFDRDGDLDIFLWGNEGPNSSILFRNDLSSGNYLVVELVGLPPNTAAAGAQIYSTVGAVTQRRDLSIGNNFISQNPMEQHFGLGNAAQVDQLVVTWPDGQQSDLGIVSANQRIVVRHPDLAP